MNTKALIVGKIILAILLVLCLFDMPYGYYQFVRFTAFIGFGYLAFKSQKKEGLLILYLALALLFQPFFKIVLGSDLWKIIDVVAAGWLILSIFLNKRR